MIFRSSLCVHLLDLVYRVFGNNEVCMIYDLIVFPDRIIAQNDIRRRAGCKHQTLKQRIARQTVPAVHTIACRLPYGIQAFHGSRTLRIHLDAPHKVMLRGDDRNARFLRIISVRFAVFDDVREVGQKLFSRDRTKVFPDMIRSIFLHLTEDRLCDDISRLKLIDKTFHILIVQKRPFSADRFGDQERSFLFVLRVECRRMYLYIIEVFQLDPMSDSDRKRISREMAEIRRPVLGSHPTA